MMIIQKRSGMLLVVLVVLTLVIAACGGDDSTSITGQPVVRLQVGDQTYEEAVYSYCWPVASDNLACDINAAALAQPVKIAGISAGDEVRFVIAGEAGAPGRFTATLLDGPGGTQDLGTSTEARYDARLDDGLYRVRVDVEYPDVQGSQAYVSYVFGLDVQGVMPTPTPTPPPTATPTDTPEPTATLTPAPTEEPAEESTEAATEVAVEPETETPQPILSPVAVAAGEEVQVAISGTVRVDAGGALVGIGGAEVRYIHTSTARPQYASAGVAITTASGEFIFAEMPFDLTDQITITAALPGYEPQSVRRTGQELVVDPVFDLVLVPIGAAVTPVPTQTPVVSTQTPVAPVPALPSPTRTPRPIIITTTPGEDNALLTLTFAGRDYAPVGYRLCQTTVAEERTCDEMAAPETDFRRIAFLRGSAAQLRIPGARPDAVHIEYLSDLGIPTGQPETRPGDNIILFVITPEPGSYILTVQVTWGQEDITFFFRVTVSD